MVLLYDTIEEHQIRLVTILPTDNDSGKANDIICCELAHFSTQDLKRSQSIPDEGGNIEFEGLVSEQFPEYMTFTPEPASASRKSRRLRTWGSHIREGMKQRIRWKATACDSIGQRKKPSAHLPKSLPESSPARYEWGDYVALSYMCGDQADRSHIVVNGERHLVTRNLEMALRELRSLDCFGRRRGSNPPLRLWIDQLSINQDDDEEKQQEMTKMAIIYRQAGNVLVWLKEQPFCHYNGWKLSSGLAMTWMQWLGRYFRTEILEALDHSGDLVKTHQHRHTANFQLRESLRMITTAIKEQFDDMDIDESGWIAIFHFANNPYFKRLWIIQELCMGRPGMPVMCAGRITQWRHVRDSMLIIAPVHDFIAAKIAEFAQLHDLEIPDPHNGAITHIAAIAEIGIHGQRKHLPYVSPATMTAVAGWSHTWKPGPEEMPRFRGTRLLQLLTLAGQANCSQPEDRVWGLMAAPGIPTLPIKKYASTTVEGVYLMFAIHCLGSGDRFAELSGAENDESRRTETTTVTQHGILQSSSVIRNYVDDGKVYSLDIFAFLDGFGNNFILPSWVPNLSMPAVRRTTPLLGPWAASGLKQGVPPPSMLTAQPLIDNPVQLYGLTCHVVSVGEIDGVGAIQSLLAKEARFVNHTHDCFTEVEDPATPISTALDSKPRHPFRQGIIQCKAHHAHPDEEIFSSSLARVLTAGADTNGKIIDAECLFESLYSDAGVTSFDDCNQWLQDFIDSSADFVVGLKPLKDWFAHDCGTTAISPASLAAIGVAKRSMFAKTRARRLVVTASKGYLGLAPMASQPGDTIVVIVGCDRPVVIRRQMVIGDKTFWRIIGECFLDGVMDGEVAQAGFHQQTSAVTFV